MAKGPVLSRWKVEGWTGDVRKLQSHPSSIWGYRCGGHLPLAQGQVHALIGATTGEVSSDRIGSLAGTAWGTEPGLGKGRNVNKEAGATGGEGSGGPEEGGGESVSPVGESWEYLGLDRVDPRECVFGAVGRKANQTLLSGRHALPLGGGDPSPA